MNSDPIAAEMILLETERELDRVRWELKETKLILEEERRVAFKIAKRADRLHMQLQAIQQVTLGEFCSIVAEGPEDLKGLQEIE
jgi:hypothetical protein